MKKPVTYLIHTAILSFVLLVTSATRISAECHALYGYNQLQGSLMVTFIDSSTSTHDITSWLWHFGDGTQSDSHNPTHTYTAPGTYEVCLTIHDNFDCTNTYCHNVIVEPVGQGDCIALFEYEQLANSLTIHFVNQSTSSHDITSRFWNFGDGHTGDGLNPNHTYAQPGSYEVCLTIHDNSDCNDTYCQVVIVEPVGQGDCIALFEYEQLANSLTIHFVNQSTSSHDITSRFWNFGDGHTGDGLNPNHTYAQPGSYEVCLTIHDNSDCNDTFCQVVIVEPIGQGDCIALFEYEQLVNSLTIHFINHSTSSHDITSYQWNFGDGHNGDGQNPNHTYNEPGTYEVCLTIHDNSNCTDTICQAVTVAPLNPQDCNALFEYEQDQNSFLIEFINLSTSSHDITSWLWTFGDGESSDQQNPHHTYDEPGTYEVCLTIHDNVNCSDTYCHIVTVNPVGQGDCMALFEYEQLANSLTIHFINHSTSSHDITSYQWNFGDGHNGDGQNPNHTYSEPGTYEVCLTIHDNNDCNDTYCHLVIVEPLSGDDCNALFTYEQAQNSFLIEFVDQSTSSHDIISWLWHFGDGESSDQHNPHHTYDAPGIYEVCLIIHDNSGCEDSYCQNITVDSVGPGDCLALFEYEQLVNTLTLHFINQSTSSHDITSYMWNFGDGHHGDDQNQNHTYDHPGTYEACLTIHDNSGCTDTYCQNVTVDSVGPGDCTASFEYVQLENSLTIHFVNHSTSSQDITSYHWNFGDGHDGDGQNPNHTYEQPGTYEVCLTVHDNTGCEDTYCLTITVEPAAQGDCTALFGYVQLENTLTIHFIDSSSSSHDITSHLWNFGDGHTGDGVNPNHTYLEPGTYEVCLTIHDNSDCNDTYCQTITVDSVPVGECNALFAYYQLQNSLTIQFVDSSSSTHDLISYLWNFGDGHIGDGHNPHHTYEHPGSYEVCLTVHDNTGCSDTYCHLVTVDSVAEGDDCMALFNYTQLGGTLTIHFINSSTSSHDITSYHWNFGDGHDGDGQNPFHTYAEPGTYEVCLTIHDNADCNDTYCVAVTVAPANESCHAVFSFDVDSTGLIVAFTNMSTNTTPATTYLWHFGDGSSSTDENPVHTYDHTDNYNVCLIIMDTTTDCSSDVCHIVHAHPSGGIQGGGEQHIAAQNVERTKSEHYNNQEHFISIYPNPFAFTTTLQYELGQAANVQIELSDLFGNRIRQIVNTNESEGVHKYRIDSGNMNPGVYFVRIMIDQEIIVKKITVTR